MTKQSSKYKSAPNGAHLLSMLYYLCSKKPSQWDGFDMSLYLI